MESSVEVRSVTRRDIPALSLVLAKAFDADPVLSWAMRQDRGRMRALSDLFIYSLEDSLKGGTSTCTSDLRSCAIWYPPGDEEGGVFDDLLMIPRIVSWAGLRRASRFASFVREMRAHRPREPHYYLDVIGVAPEAQGKGYGSSLLSYTLALVDAGKHLAYLESTSLRNNILYERHGFKVLFEKQLPGGGPPLWYMHRVKHHTDH